MRRTIRNLAGCAVLAVVVACTSPSGPVVEPESDAASTLAADSPAIESDPAVDLDTPSAGDLIYGIAADTVNAWAPYRASCGPSCLLVMHAISDPLFVRDAEGELKPHLVSSSTMNDDATEHVFRIRPGVRFHDGSALDGAAVAFNLETCRLSALSGAVFSGISSIRGSGQSVTITTSSPWGALPELLADRGCAFMFSPTWLASLPDIPFRDPGAPWFDSVLAADPADGDPAAPVGLGGFVLESYVPGPGNSLVASRNDDYWQEGLPTLDSIEFIVIPDPAVRVEALETGLIHAFHTETAVEIDADFVTRPGSYAGVDTVAIITNLEAQRFVPLAGGGDEAVAPEGSPRTSGSPLRLPSCRNALALATDRASMIDDLALEWAEAANGPFPPGSLGHLADNGSQTFDLDAARSSFETCVEEFGEEPIAFRLDTFDDPLAIEAAQLLVGQWFDAFGSRIEVSLRVGDSVEIAEWALLGTFDAMLWRSHGGVDPDAEFNAWFSGAAGRVGEPSLNVTRLADAAVDEALLEVRRRADAAARRAAAEELNRAIAASRSEIGLYWLRWSVVHGRSVVGIDEVGPGFHTVVGLSCVDGRCG